MSKLHAHLQAHANLPSVVMDGKKMMSWTNGFTRGAPEDPNHHPDQHRDATLTAVRRDALSWMLDAQWGVTAQVMTAVVVNSSPLLTDGAQEMPGTSGSLDKLCLPYYSTWELSL
ncbi:hypothetical protein PoB_006350500 [Plakobranchus ocellatus]|uniref:Uncharacterized protein n=1 Tax=Plakobranchus ocellatus TaxID=259542 RepID=A0AAV4CYN9_9GAST|nr:hypothetical protein PoB_006350500 [Plakobranchus ocellatus]